MITDQQGWGLAEVAAEVKAQDVEVSQIGTATLRQEVAKDRRISIEDAQMHHGRKSRSVRVDGVQLLDMVDKSIPLCKPTSGRFFRHGADRGGHLLLERGSIRLLLLSLAPPTPHHDTATAPGCRRLKQKPESRGKKVPRAPSIVGSFSPQPWLESAR